MTPQYGDPMPASSRRISQAVIEGAPGGFSCFWWWGQPCVLEGTSQQQSLFPLLLLDHVANGNVVHCYELSCVLNLDTEEEEKKKAGNDSEVKLYKS